MKAFLLIFFLVFYGQAQVLNEVLFELNQEVWTSYDYKQFLKAKSKVPLNGSYLKQAQNDQELFLLTRLLFYQQMSSMSTAESLQYGLLTKYRDQKDSFNAEVQRLKMITENEDSRYQQLVTKDKYELWLNYMKKKYNYTPQ